MAGSPSLWHKERVSWLVQHQGIKGGFHGRFTITKTKSTEFHGRLVIISAHICKYVNIHTVYVLSASKPLIETDSEVLYTIQMLGSYL